MIPVRPEFHIMNSQPMPKDRSLSHFVARFSALDNFCRSLLFKKFHELKHGHLQIEDHSGNPIRNESFGDESSPLKIRLIVLKSRFYSRTLLGGSIGNAESYIDGDWETNELPDLVRLFVLNRNILEGIDSGIGGLLQPFQKYFHGLKKNTIEGARENIRSHYDIGNDFFKLFLDDSMMYSSAVFKAKEMSLYEASMNKVEMVVKKLKLKATDHLVEIGTGWGTLAIYAAKAYGCRVTTTTISREQYDYAFNQIKAEGLEDRITLLFEDYRNITGVFDALVSVEMIEAVGLDHLETYFEKCSSLVKPDGIMVLQAITIRDQNYEAARKSVDFIQRHIFPGCGIPSVHAIMNSIAKKTDLALIGQEEFAEDYAETLKRWSENLTKNEKEVRKLGYPEFLYRLWHYYFSYCEGGFRERAIGLSQMVFAKPLYKERNYL